MVIITFKLIIIGGTPPYSGVKKAATLGEAEVPTPCLGMWMSLKANLPSTFPDSNLPILCREEADNMCKMMAASSYALHDHEDLGKFR